MSRGDRAAETPLPNRMLSGCRSLGRVPQIVTKDHADPEGNEAACSPAVVPRSRWDSVAQ